MIRDNHLIVIYGKTASYKSCIGNLIANSYANSCYLDLEGNANHNDLNYDTDIYEKKSDLKKCLNDYDVIVVDNLELLGKPIKKLKEAVIDTSKTLIVLTQCREDADLINNDHYKEIKEVADLVIIMDR